MLMRSRSFLAGVLLALAAGVMAATSGGFPSRPRLQSLGVNATPPATGSITASGTITGATLAGAYNAGSLTGSIADARLSSNVPLKNAANTFTTAGGLLLAPASGNSYITSQRASQSTGQVGFALNGGTSGTDWLLFQSASSDAFNIFGNSATRLSISSAGNVTVNAPSSGVALRSDGVYGSAAVYANSANGSGGAGADVFVTRAGSTANAVEQGANIELNDSSGSTASTWQHAGGQTELWQYNGGWNQILKVGTARAVTINAPSSGDTLTLNGNASGNGLTVAGQSGQGAYVAVKTNSGYMGLAGLDGSTAKFFAGQVGSAGDFFNIYTGASNTLRVTVGSGVQVGAPTGGDKGVGTLNAQQVWQSGVRVPYIAFAAITGGGGCTVSGGAYSANVASCSTGGTGLYTVTLSALFGGVPACTGSIRETLTSRTIAVKATSATSVSVTIAVGSTGAAVDSDFAITCMGF